MDEDQLRKLFEERVFNDYYVRGIKRNPDPGPRISGALDFVPTCEYTLSEFCERKEDGSYVKQELNMMWHGWKLATKHYEKYGVPKSA